MLYFAIAIYTRPSRTHTIILKDSTLTLQNGTITDVESVHLTISFHHLIAPFFVDDRYLDESRSILYIRILLILLSEKWSWRLSI